MTVSKKQAKSQHEIPMNMDLFFHSLNLSSNNNTKTELKE